VVAAVLGSAALANVQVPVVHWQLVGKIPARGRSAQALVVDPQSGTLYVGMEHGLYVSRDGGVNWESLVSAGVPISSSVLAFDAKQSVLFGTDGHTLFRMASDNSWQVFTVSATNDARLLSAQGRRAIWGLAADDLRGVLYVGTLQELLRSFDGGETWEWESSLPTEGQTLALDEMQGDMYVAALANNELYRSRDGGKTWFSQTGTSVDMPAAYLTAWDQWAVMGRWIDGDLFWAAESMQGLWKLPRAILESQNCLVRPLSGANAELLCAWGLMLLRSDVQVMPLPWLALRLWIWQFTTWLAANGSLAAMSLIALLGLLLAAALGRTYVKVSRPWGVPWWVAWFAPDRVAHYAHPAALEKAWPVWEKRVRAELARFDDVIPADLVDIPALLRHYALQRYALQNAPGEWLDVRPAHLRLPEAARLRLWREATRWSRDNRPELEDPAGRGANAQAKLLAEALGVNLGDPQVLAGGRVYLAEARALPGVALAHLHLIVLEAAWLETVKVLADRLQKSPEDFALLVISESEAGAAELRQAMVYFPTVTNFVVLGHDEVTRLLLAREPRQLLADLILRPTSG
jgi:hypothetical protein